MSDYAIGPDNVRKVTLDKIAVGIQLAVSEHLMGATVDVEQVLQDQFVFRLRGYLMGHKLPERKFSYPSDWWQAFKLRWFPAWALKRYPVRYTVITVSANALYPDFKVALPDQRHFIDVAVWQRDETWDVDE